MSWYTPLLIGLFLPLFPLSMVFNHLLDRVSLSLVRIGLLLLWPQMGLALFFLLEGNGVSLWVVSWAVLTALLYGFRLLTQRDVHGWVGFLATSTWSLLWLLLATETHTTLAIHALGFSIPLILVALLAIALQNRFGAAYTHLYGDLATTMPRLAGLLVFSTLAATATPIFPAFFSMLKIVSLLIINPLIAVIALLTWLSWSWAGIRLLQGLLVGPAHPACQVKDLHRGSGWLFTLILVLLAASGLFVSGTLT